MLTIRDEQFKAFSQAGVKKFEEWMLAHLRRFFPKECLVLGDAPVLETIRKGIDRAAAYEMTSKSDVCKYIDLMVVFGPDFDTDKRFPWAGEVLAERRSSSAKMQALHAAARKHLRQS